MGKSLVRTKQQISQFNEERPIYGEILDFYDLVLEEQGKTRPQFQIRTIDFDKEPLKSRRRRGVALLEREEFEIDRGAAEKLSHNVCRIG